MSRLSVWRASPFVLVGLVLWLATVQAGVHASIAGMFGGLLVAAREPDRGAVEGAASGFRAFRQSPLVPVAGPRAGASTGRSRSTSGCSPGCTRGPATSSSRSSPSPTPASTCAAGCSPTR